MIHIYLIARLRFLVCNSRYGRHELIQVYPNRVYPWGQLVKKKVPVGEIFFALIQRPHSHRHAYIICITRFIIRPHIFFLSYSTLLYKMGHYFLDIHYNHCSMHGHWLLKKFWPFGNRLRSTHCREFLCMKLCRSAYFAKITQLLPHPGHEQWGH